MRSAALKRRAVICELAAIGLTRHRIATAAGCSYPLVVNVLRAAGLKLAYDKSSLAPTLEAAKDRAAEMATLYASGMTLDQIGKQYGVSRERVRQVIGKHHGMNGRDGGQTVTAARNAAKRLAARDAKCLAQRGCTYAQYKAMPRKATYAYVQQRRNAHSRGIEWQFNLWQWWCVWQSSGHWAQRGRGAGRFVMCRRGDVGPYSPGNVFIATCEQNISEGNRRADSDLPIGVHRNESGTFSTVRAGRNLGTYKTIAQAQSAYLLNKPLSSRVRARTGWTKKPSGLPPGVSRNNKTGMTKPYRAYFYVGSKQIHVGSFATAEEAHAAHLKAKAANTNNHPLPSDAIQVELSRTRIPHNGQVA